MQQNEGRELVEYAVIAVLVSLGVTLLLSGTGGYLLDVWNAVTRMVIG